MDTFPFIHAFQADVTDIELPTEFTDPFHYEPHALCKLAAREVQSYIDAHPLWVEELQQGKMFGVLVVETQAGLRFLAAYSGLLQGRNDIPYFVPAVFDLLDPQGHFKQEEAAITEINHIISRVEDNRQKRATALRHERKVRSQALQDWVFHQFIMLNKKGEARDLSHIFQEARHKAPPSGAGECAAPKLLQQAFLHHWRPIAMAEFWWGADSADRIHRRFYPACEEKCRPILEFMLNDGTNSQLLK